MPPRLGWHANWLGCRGDHAPTPTRTSRRAASGTIATSSSRARRLWQIVAGVELVAFLVVGIGFVWLSIQHKIVPYVVEVDFLGAALAIKLAERGGRPADERIVRYQLDAFLRGARQVMTDGIAMKKAPEQVYAYTRGPACTVLDDYRANNPFEIAKTYVVVPVVTSL